MSINAIRSTRHLVRARQSIVSGDLTARIYEGTSKRLLWTRIEFVNPTGIFPVILLKLELLYRHPRDLFHLAGFWQMAAQSHVTSILFEGTFTGRTSEGIVIIVITFHMAIKLFFCLKVRFRASVDGKWTAKLFIVDVTHMLIQRIPGFVFLLAIIAAILECDALQIFQIIREFMLLAMRYLRVWKLKKLCIYVQGAD